MRKKKITKGDYHIELIKTTHHGKEVIKQKISKNTTFAQDLQWIVILVCVIFVSGVLIFYKINERTPLVSNSSVEADVLSLIPASDSTSAISIEQPTTSSETNMPGPTAFPTVEGVRQMNDIGVVTTNSVKVRLCAGTDCPDIGSIRNGDTFTITGRVIDGQDVAGNRLWYQISYFNQVGYVSAAMVGIASAQPVAPVGQVVEPISVAPAVQWVCQGNLYDCSDFGSREELMSYFNACPGDPSRMDGDGDGIPCERNF